MITLRNIPESMSYLADVNDAGALLGFRMLRAPGWNSAYVTMEGEFTDYLTANLGKQRRRGILQKVRQLSEQPGYGLAAFRRPEEMPLALDRRRTGRYD